jgi:hypothetical protein
VALRDIVVANARTTLVTHGRRWRSARRLPARPYCISTGNTPVEKSRSADTWDAHTSELAIIYDRQVNGRPDRAAEILRFGVSGRVVQGEVFYGVANG